MFVRNMNSAGTEIIICTSASFASLKYAWIVLSAGATAAPAITVRSDSDRIATVRPPLLSLVIIFVSYLFSLPG